MGTATSECQGSVCGLNVSDKNRRAAATFGGNTGADGHCTRSSTATEQRNALRKTHPFEKGTLAAVEVKVEPQRVAVEVEVESSGWRAVEVEV